MVFRPDTRNQDAFPSDPKHGRCTSWSATHGQVMSSTKHAHQAVREERVSEKMAFLLHAWKGSNPLASPTTKQGGKHEQFRDKHEGETETRKQSQPRTRRAKPVQVFVLARGKNRSPCRRLDLSRPQVLETRLYGGTRLTAKEFEPRRDQEQNIPG